VLGDAQQQGQVTHRLSRGREQQPLRRIGKRPDASQEALFDLACQRPRVGADEPACQFGRGQPSRQLQQGEGVTAGFCDDPIFDALVDAAGHGRFQERTGVAVAQAADHELRQARQLVVTAEQLGGSPDKKPHGPVIAAGKFGQA